MIVQKEKIAFLFLFVCGVIFSSTAFAAQCPNRDVPDINISLTSKAIQYDFTRSKSQLRGYQIDTVSPYDKDAHTEVGGLMNGEISVNSQVSFGWAQSKRTGKSCFWYNKVDIKMHINPTILVASEHPEGTCMHDSILEHEMKHIRIDRVLLKKYKDILERDLKNIVSRVGVVGPVSSSSAERARAKMMRIIEKTVSTRTEAMYAERRHLQQAVDSLEEYERVQARCP